MAIPAMLTVLLFVFMMNLYLTLSIVRIKKSINNGNKKIEKEKDRLKEFRGDK